MRKLLLALLTAGALLVPTTAPAGTGTRGEVLQKWLGVVLDGIALDGAASTRTTSVMHVESHSVLTLTAFLTYDAATSIDISYCEGTGDQNNGTGSEAPDWSFIMAVPSLASDGTSSYRTWKASANDDGTALAADFDATFTVSVLGHKHVRCVFAGGGSPTSSDLLTVRAAVSAP